MTTAEAYIALRHKHLVKHKGVLYLKIAGIIHKHKDDYKIRLDDKDLLKCKKIVPSLELLDTNKKSISIALLSEVELLTPLEGAQILWDRLTLKQKEMLKASVLEAYNKKTDGVKS